MVARGEVSLDDAAESLAARAVLLPETPFEPIAECWAQHIETWRWMLGETLEQLRVARIKIEAMIARAIGPMVDVRKPSEELLARARAVNAEHRGLLDDADVLAVVVREVTWRTRTNRR